ncbi:MAG: stage III sporulation protein AE [Clostridiales bacterium]|nr:stage III sporulation protein AE [Candidatus Apopatousia equi]
MKYQTMLGRKFNNFQTKKERRVKLIFAIILLVFACFLIVYNNVKPNVFADNKVNDNYDIQSSIDEQLKDLDMTEYEDLVNNLSNAEKNIFNSDSFIDKVKKLISGEAQVNFSSLFAQVLSVFSTDLLSVLPLIASIIGVGLLSSVITQTSYTKSSTVSDIVHFVCYGFIITVVFASITEVISITSSTLSSLKSQMEIGFPILLTLMTALGSTVSVSVYQPAVALLSGSLMNIFSNFILPLFIFCLVFTVAGNLSSNIKLNKFSSLFSSIFKWSIGLIFTIFTGFLAVQGITAGSYDGLSIRTAKYAMKSYIPFVGSYLSDGMNLILTSSVLIKNSVGMAGLILLFATVISPIFKILMLKFALFLSASILEPICDKRISDFLSKVSKCLSMLIATLCVASFAYFITVGLIMCTSNVL